MSTILDKIVAQKRKDLARAMQATSLAALKKQAARMPAPLDLAGALRPAARDGIRLIAEVKKASPSKGLLKPDFDPVRLARAYADGGAAAISVLTEEPHFQGSLSHLESIACDLAQRSRRPPLLRKDFIFDRYQIFEARVHGADAVLLIAAILESDQLFDLIAQANGLGMQALVEVHDAKELAGALEAGASIVGINNRDLRTFHTDLATTQRLVQAIPAGCVRVSESGIQSRQDLAALRSWGVDAVLVGEALVTAKDPSAKMRELIGVK
jgi:indole-3-glycerol phosphate synthase